jgi:hypothetical protein
MSHYNIGEIHKHSSLRCYYNSEQTSATVSEYALPIKNSKSERAARFCIAASCTRFIGVAGSPLVECQSTYAALTHQMSLSELHD